MTQLHHTNPRKPTTQPTTNRPTQPTQPNPTQHNQNRGKRRAGFEFEIDGELAGDKGGEKIESKFSIPSVVITLITISNGPNNLNNSHNTH